MKMLKAKLYQLKLEEQEREMAEIRGEQKLVGKPNSFICFPSLFNGKKIIEQMKRLVKLMQSWMGRLDHSLNLI